METPIIRQMTRSDVGFAFACVRSEGWLGETPEVFETFLAHDRRGCWVAQSGAPRRGSAPVHDNGSTRQPVERLVVKRAPQNARQTSRRLGPCVADDRFIVEPFGKHDAE